MTPHSEQHFRGEDLERFVKWRTVDTDACIACHSRAFSSWARSGTYESVQCKECGLIWMNPSLTNEGLGEYYSDYIGRRRLSNQLKMEQRKVQYELDREVIEHFIASGKVLDVGCSGGFFLEALSDDFEKHGIEIDPEAVAYAREHQKSFGKNIQCVALSEVPYRDGAFDLVMMRGTIEHLREPVAAIEKVAALLKRGGYYFITATPNGDAFSADLYRDKWTLYHPVQHLWHFSPRTLSLICGRFGLKLIAKEFPYLGTPYEKVRENVKAVAEAVRLREKDPDAELPVSPAFWENMMSLVFQKTA